MGIYSSNLGGPHTSVNCNQESGRGTNHYRDCSAQMEWWGGNFNGKLSDQMRDEALLAGWRYSGSSWFCPAHAKGCLIAEDEARLCNAQRSAEVHAKALLEKAALKGALNDDAMAAAAALIAKEVRERRQSLAREAADLAAAVERAETGARAKTNATAALAKVLTATARAAGEDALRAELVETEAKAARLRARLR